MSFSDAYGLRQDWIDRIRSTPQEAAAEPVPAELARLDPRHFDPGTERNASYYYTSGLVAVHAANRTREAIWDALDARRVYGTSGPRILLWFDLLKASGGTLPMGSEVFLSASAAAPRFRVRAAGAFEQLPGCPADTLERLTPERVEHLCRGECYHPSDRRHAIEAIEVVRIRPQTRPDEPLAELVDDPWQVLACPPGASTCVVEFEDPDYDGSREFLYYVRALQSPTPVINGKSTSKRLRILSCGRPMNSRMNSFSGSRTFSIVWVTRNPS